MNKKEAKIAILTFDKILNESYKYCKYEDNEKIREKAIKINGLAYESIKYINRYVLRKKKKKGKKKKG